MKKNQRDKGGGIIELILSTTVLVIVAYAVTSFISTGGEFFSESIFFDSDVYSWLVRVEALHEGQGWFDHSLYGVNPPEGHIQHWTRPLDAILWAGGLILSPILGFRDGLALWANLISPLLHLLVLWPMWRAARLLLSSEEAAWAVGAFALHWGVLVSFHWGRADHHSLLVGAQVVFFLAFMSFFLKEEGRLQNAFLCGLFGAFAVWVNLEALFYVLVGLVALGLYWLKGHRDLLESSVLLSLGLTLGTAVGTAVEWGPFMFERHPVDTISMIYVAVFGLTTGFWAVLWAVDGRRPEPLEFVHRVGLAALCALVVFGGIYLTAPELFGGPFHMVEELYKETRLANIGEQGPMLAFGESSAMELMGLTVSFLYLVPIGLWVSWKRFTGDLRVKERWLWGTLGMMALVCVILAQGHAGRWLVYMPFGAAFGYGVFCRKAHHWLQTELPALVEPLKRPGAIFLLLFSPMFVGVMLTESERGEEVEYILDDDERGARDISGVVEICDGRIPSVYLNNPEEFPEPTLLFVDPTYGSEFLYRTDHFILSVANHRPQPGYRFFVENMREVDHEEAHRRLVERGVEIVLMCVLDATKTDIWGARTGPGDQLTLMDALMRGSPEGGFQVIADPVQGGGWWIYEVVDE